MSSKPDRERLRRILGGVELEPFRARLRERLARGQALSGRMRLTRLGRRERDAVAALFGLSRGRSEGGALQVSLDALDERLRSAQVCDSLRQAVEALDGPVADRRQARDAATAAWRAVWDDASREVVFAQKLAVYLGRLEERGLLRRLSGGDPAVAARLLSEVARLAALWPVPGWPLAALAARVLGDAHGLDPGTPLATLAVRAAASFGSVPFHDSAEGQRAAWAAVGVLCDELSTPALVLNLPAAADTPLAKLLREAATAGEPMHLSLRILLRHPLSGDPALDSRDVFVCENPSIVALAAARLGTRCRPLVCTNGQPATPVQVLLRQLAASGARLHYHGDFDRGGLRIARYVIERFGARPWRMGASDYLAAVQLGRALERLPGLSPWDPGLVDAMGRERRVVHEEAVADDLLADLGVDAPGRGR